MSNQKVSSVMQSDVNRMSGKEFLSNISQDLNGIAAQTSNMFTDFFGKDISSKCFIHFFFIIVKNNK